MAMDLQKLLSGTHKKTYKGNEFVIKEITLDQVPDLAHLFQKFYGSKDIKKSVMDLVTQDLPSVKKLITSLTEFSDSDLNQIGLDYVIFLAVSIVEVNTDFLLKTIAPLVQEMAKVMSGMSKSNS